MPYHFSSDNIIWLEKEDRRLNAQSNEFRMSIEK